MPNFALFAHQQRMVDFCEKRQGRAGLFADMRTGKTRATLAFLHNKASRILILAPLWVCGVWLYEMEQVGYDYDVLTLTSGLVKSRTAKLRAQSGDRMVVIANWEAAWRQPLRNALVTWLKGSTDSAVVAEESHKIANRVAKSSKFAHLLGTIPQVKYRLALTGTPTRNGVEDLFSQYRFFDSSIFGTRWLDFERDYLIRGGYMDYSIVAYRNLDLLQAKVAATAFQITRAEALGPEEYTDSVVPVELSTSNRNAYHHMKKDQLATFLHPDGGSTVTTSLARSALTTILRLQQITSGFTMTEEEGIVDLGTEKLDVCEQIVRDAWDQGRSCVVFARFRHDIERIAQRLNLPPHAQLMGGMSSADKERALDELRAGTLHAVVAQITLASLGVDMSSASTAIYYSVGFSLTDFSQSLARLFGPRQQHAVDIYHLICADSVDAKVYQALKSKQDIARKVVDLGYCRQLFA